jgi:hypothetical protein
MPDTVLETPAGTYRWHEDWVSIPGRAHSPNGRTHGVAVARSGHLYIFHQAVPGMLEYDAAGKLLSSWGEYPGAHGLTLVEEYGQEFFWLTDEKRLAVEKTTLQGKVVQQLAPPPYAATEPYIPTWVAVNEVRRGGNGDIWVADGYGSSRISRYNAAGTLLQVLDGTTGGGRFDCPHGLWFDVRKPHPELYIADRGNHRVQVLDGEGRYLRTFGQEFLTSPDCFAVHNEMLIVPELFGRLTLLDGQDRLVAHIGVNESVRDEWPWPNETELVPGLFNSPHGATVDLAGNVFVVEWRLGGRVLKLEKLG